MPGFKRKSPEQVTKDIASRAIHRKVDPKRKVEFPEESSVYDVKRSKTMVICPNCGGLPELIRDCLVCEGKGRVQSQAITRKLRHRSEMPEHRLVGLLKKLVLSNVYTKSQFEADLKALAVEIKELLK